MQQHMGHQAQEELKEIKERLAAAEEEKYRALDELGEMKNVAQEANMRLSEALSAQAIARGSLEVEKSWVNGLHRARVESAKKRGQGLQLELEAVHKQHALVMEALSVSSQELNMVCQQLALALKEKDSAFKEVRNARQVAEANAKKVADLFVNINVMNEAMANLIRELEIRLKSIESLKLELKVGKQIEIKLTEKDASETRAMDFLSESKMRVQTLEAELVKSKESETKMFDSLVSQTKQLEQTKVLLEESKLEIASLHEKIESLEVSVAQSNGDKYSTRGTFETLKPKLQLAKESLTHAKKGEELASSKAEEMSLLKAELKLAMEAEEKSKKAMDDLVLALNEVATEAKQVKEELISTQSELENVKGEAEHFKQMVRSTNGKNKGLLDEAKREIDQIKDVAERLRLESEESILSWNGKEIAFINCIKRAEEESTAMKQENVRLMEALRVAEDMNNVSREEKNKLRDILKQALNEANLSKEAAGIARAENSQLKDSLFEKDNALDSLSRENEHLRISEASAKRLLSLTPTKDSKERGGAFEKHNSIIQEHNKDGRKVTKVLSLNLKEMKIPNGYKHKEADEDPEKAKALKGSIFDLLDSPNPLRHHRKFSSSVIADDAETINSEDFDYLDGTQLDDMENDRNSQRKKRALIRRFGDLLRRRSFYRKDPSIE